MNGNSHTVPILPALNLAIGLQIPVNARHPKSGAIQLRCILLVITLVLMTAASLNIKNSICSYDCQLGHL
jgi:hypothetical protein